MTHDMTQILCLSSHQAFLASASSWRGNFGHILRTLGMIIVTMTFPLAMLAFPRPRPTRKPPDPPPWKPLLFPYLLSLLWFKSSFAFSPLPHYFLLLHSFFPGHAALPAFLQSFNIPGQVFHHPTIFSHDTSNIPSPSHG